MAPAWNTDRSLLNPRFESYKLSTGTLSYATSSLLSSEPCGRVLQGSSTDEEPTLGWREAHFRASFNHLFPVEEGLAWIDAAGRMWAASKGNLGNVRLAGRIPLPRSEAKQQQQQWGLYASIVQVSGKWIVSDGWGTLHLFDYANSQIQYSASLSTPFNLHAAHQTPDLNVLLLLSHPTSKDKATTGDRIRLLCVTFHLDQPTLQVLHTFKGDQYPVYSSIGHQGQATIAAASPFVNVTQPASQPEEAVTLPESVQTTALKIPAFSWTQDEESVILTFPLPDELQNNPPKDLKVVFTPSFLNIHAPRHPDLSLSHRKLWGPIDTSLSTWSFDGGRLTIAMEKTHQGTTWPTIFDESITDSTFNPPQQYSDDQLEAMKDVLSHMTSEHAEEGEGPPSSSLLGDGADRDELSNSGDHLVRKQVFDVHSGNITAEASQPFELLSTALPIAGQPQAHLAPSLVVKRQVDGLLLDGSWRHTSTYPALSYILASKRTLNLRFIVHHEADFCAAVDSNGSLFVYRGLQEPKASHGQQAVLQPDHVSDIVGAAWVPDAGMVILTSTQMVLVKGLVSSQ